MKKCKRASLIALIAFSSVASAGLSYAGPAYGGNDHGNGGDAIKCPGHAMLLDYYEAQNYFGPLDLGGPTLTVTQKVLYVLDRLARIDSSRAASYRKRFEAFEGEASRRSGVELVDVPDSGQTLLPVGCKIEQLAIQKEPEFSWEKYYLINQDLYQLLPVDHQAGLILHEIIYREALEKEHVNSIRARVFNGLIATAGFANLSVQAYLNYVKETGLRNYPQIIDGMEFRLGSVEFYTTGQVKEGFVVGGHYKSAEGCAGYFFRDDRVEFFSDGKLKASKAGVPSQLLFPGGRCQKFPRNEYMNQHKEEVSFYENGVPKSWAVRPTPGYGYASLGKYLTFGDEMKRFDGQIEFWPNGRVRRANFVPERPSIQYQHPLCSGPANFKEALMTNQGMSRNFGCGYLDFDEQGRVIVQP